MSSLLAESLRDFSGDSWWAVCDALVDGDASASLPDLVARVRDKTRKGDLVRASASYGTDAGEDEGAAILAEKILDTFTAQAIVEQDGDVWRVTEAYLAYHRLDEGGIRFAYNRDGNWSSYDARPATVRGAREQSVTDRHNTLAAISSAAKYRRPVQTGEERSSKFGTAKRAAFDLYTSLREHGYLDAFPVTIDRQFQIVAGNHRLRFAELARQDLLEELEEERANGADEVVVADLERRIASLDRDRILREASVFVERDADAVRVTTASEIQIEWTAHEKKQLAGKLMLDGLDVAEVAAMLNESERTIRAYTADVRGDHKEIQRAEAARLVEAGWSQRKVAKHLGVKHGTVQNWLKSEVANFGARNEISHPASEPPPEPKPRKEKLTEEQQREAARLVLDEGQSAESVGKLFGVSRMPVLRAVEKEKGRREAEAPQPPPSQPCRCSECGHVHERRA